jgi:hypothetical protein
VQNFRAFLKRQNTQKKNVQNKTKANEKRKHGRLVKKLFKTQKNVTKISEDLSFNSRL